MSLFKVAIFSLNQWALDFGGNTDRIIKSIDLAHQAGAVYRAGPELELCGYSLDDAFFESDTVHHSWTCLRRILNHITNIDIVVDVGMPIKFGSLYNCRVICYRGKVLCIRAKTSLAKDGIYREFRHFTAWPVVAGAVPFKLPPICSPSGKSEFVPFGANFILELDKNFHSSTPLKIGWEVCQELWDNKNVSADLYHKFGCHLVVNSSGSYWELRKLELINAMIKSVSTRSGACYAYSNLVGCDGQRNVFYGRSCMYDNGKLVAITPTRSIELFDEVQMITCNINPGNIDVNRSLLSDRPNVALSMCRILNLQDESFDVSKIDSSYRVFRLTIGQQQVASINRLENDCSTPLSLDIDPKIRFEEEIDNFVSLWLWDYLRRSRMRGFTMPLSGGLDSSSVAVLVFSMCNRIYDLLDNQSVQDYFESCHKIPPESLKETLKSPRAICKLILKCCYLSTRYSSQETENRAKVLCRAIGANYESLSIQEIYDKCRQISPSIEASAPGKVSLLEQNLQARLRMTMTYYMSEGNRIVLATGNVDEAIMGYLTKYDCSSADINPIGGLCKEDLKSYLKYCSEHLFATSDDLVEILDEIICAPPSAELTGSEQRDEDEIGLTYDEISVLGKVRRGIYGCSGPRSAFEIVWRNRNNPPFSTNIRCFAAMSSRRDLGQIATELGELIKRFYQRYVRNRHKLTVLTPALHAESYSPDDNRFDHRQFLYPSLTYQFECIDQLIAEIKQSGRIS